MGPDERERFTDELLDATLRQYGSVTPRAGLEQRLLAGVRAIESAATAPRRWQWVALAAAASLAVALGIYVAVPSEETQPATPSAQAPDVTKPVERPAVPTEEGTKPAPRRTLAKGAPPRALQPKLDVFPAPAAISEQERLALYYARRAPAEVLVAAAAAVEKPLTSLHIEEIKVEPLQPEGTGENPPDGIQK
jgi:hypothetical protein